MRNISFDFLRLYLSRSVNRFFMLRFFRMLLHSFTRIGVICIAPHEFPFTALQFPSLSTWIIAFITGSQSKLFVCAFAVSLPTGLLAVEGMLMPIKNKKINTALIDFIILMFLWDLNFVNENRKIRKLMLVGNCIKA